LTRLTFAGRWTFFQCDLQFDFMIAEKCKFFEILESFDNFDTAAKMYAPRMYNYNKSTTLFRKCWYCRGVRISPFYFYGDFYFRLFSRRNLGDFCPTVVWTFSEECNMLVNMLYIVSCVLFVCAKFARRHKSWIISEGIRLEKVNNLT